jgi:hypothetical protein
VPTSFEDWHRISVIVTVRLSLRVKLWEFKIKRSVIRNHRYSVKIQLLSLAYSVKTVASIFFTVKRWTPNLVPSHKFVPLQKEQFYHRCCVIMFNSFDFKQSSTAADFHTRETNFTINRAVSTFRAYIRTYYIHAYMYTYINAHTPTHLTLKLYSSSACLLFNIILPCTPNSPSDLLVSSFQIF